MFGIGSGELFVIIIVAVMLLGPDKLPGAMRTFGKFMADVKNATNDIKHEITNTAEVKDLTNSVTKVTERFTGEIDKIKDSVGAPNLDFKNDITSTTQGIKEDFDDLTGPIKRQL